MNLTRLMLNGQPTEYAYSNALINVEDIIVWRSVRTFLTFTPVAVKIEEHEFSEAIKKSFSHASQDTVC